MQVNCFAKHLEIAKTKVGLEFFSAKKQFLNSLLPTPPTLSVKWKWRILSQVLTQAKTYLFLVGFNF